jgi:hypothetical protein
MSLSCAVVSAASIFLSLSTAFAQQVTPSASSPCNAATRGTANWPTYTVPASTTVPRAAMDGSVIVPTNTSTPLFNGAVPPNGFMVQAIGVLCFVNDNGPASTQAGFTFGNSGTAGADIFVTPPGYKPIGAVSVYCAGSAYVAARNW